MPEEKHVDGDAPELLTDNVINKYINAGQITNDVLKELIAKSVDGANVLELCTYGDSRIRELTSKTFKKEKKDLEKGIAMPTCISVNNVVCHYSPLKSDPDVRVLHNGDVVKIDLGAHIDGYMATAAHTFVVGASKEEKVKDKKADVIVGAHNAIEAAIRTLQPTKKLFTTDVTKVISKVAEQFKVTPVESMLSHQIGRFDHNGSKEIIQNPTEEQAAKHEKKQFAEHEAYVIDIFLSTGDGKSKPSDLRTTVYRKNDIVYQLKMKHARQFFSEAVKQYNNMPFSLRSFENEVQTKLGVVECERHGLMQPYGILVEREGEYVAQFKYTVLLTAAGILKIAGLPFDDSVYEPELTIQDQELVNLLKEPLKLKKAKKEADAEKKEPEAQK